MFEYFHVPESMRMDMIYVLYELKDRGDKKKQFVVRGCFTSYRDVRNVISKIGMLKKPEGGRVKMLNSHHESLYGLEDVDLFTLTLFDGDIDMRTSGAYKSSTEIKYIVKPYESNRFYTNKTFDYPDGQSNQCDPSYKLVNIFHTDGSRLLTPLNSFVDDKNKQCYLNKVNELIDEHGMKSLNFIYPDKERKIK